MKIKSERISSNDNKRKVLSLITVSLSLMLLSIILVVTDPVSIIIRYRTRLRKGSEIWKLLSEKDTPGIHVSAYLFNVTNAERFLSGEDHKLKVQEVGPFTYLEQRTNMDMDIDEEAGVLRYSPRATAKFLPDLSMADPNDVNVTMPNVSMLTMTSMITSHPYLTRVGFNLLLGSLKTKAIVPQTAQEFLWGYDEPLIKIGNTFLPGWISFNTLGIMDRGVLGEKLMATDLMMATDELYDNTVEYRLEVGINEEDRFRVKTMNGFHGLNVWDYGDKNKRTKCNTFTDAYEGIAYPTDFPTGAPVRIFRNVLCRFLPLEFQGTQYINSTIPALTYKISKNAFSINNDTQCHCYRGNCINGVSDISPCFYKLPLALSNAHFLNADPSLYKRIEGISPDETKHGNEFLIEPKLGMVLKTHFSVQVNVVVKKVDFNEQAGRFSDMVVPVVYFKLVQPELLEDNKYSLYLVYVVAPYAFWSIIAFLLLSGFLTLVYCVRMFLTNWIYSRDVIVFQMPEGDKTGITSSIPLLGIS